MSIIDAALGKITAILGNLFGSANERSLKLLWPRVEEVKACYPMAQALRDEDFAKKTTEFRRRFCQGESLDNLLNEAYAVCREAAHRTLGGKKIVHDKWIGRDIRYMGHFDVQILGGIVLHEGRIAEMVTGEGKTLVATLPAYLNSLAPNDEWIAISKEVQGKDPADWIFTPFVRETEDAPWVLIDAAREQGLNIPVSIATVMPVGRGVHVVTTNDYLVTCGCEENRPLFEFLGLTVGAIQSDMAPEERIPAYLCDVTYGTNNEFGFDYLRDNLKVNSASQVQRSRAFAIIDEVDSVLIDEARTPLIISGRGEHATDKYYAADRVASKLTGRHQNDVDEMIMANMKQGWQREAARIKAEEGVDYIYSERDHSAKLTEQGQNRVMQLLGIKDLYAGNNLEWLHYIDNALRANSLYKRDHHYVVKDGQIVIVDEFTGRLMEGRRWSDGLHQAVEAKENLRIKEESQTIASITFQNFFKLYGKLSGMTGTAMTEAKEFFSTYGLDVVSIPTNRPLLRKNWTDLIYGTEKEKYNAIVEHVATIHGMGRPLLIGTISIERSEMLSKLLERRGIPHEVLNAKQHAREAQIVAQAGEFSHVTIATNMAGRGTDIKLGSITREELLAHWKKWKLAPKEASAGMPEEELERLCVTRWAEVWLAEEELPRGEERSIEELKALLQKRWEEEGLHPLSITDSVAALGGLHVVGTERHEARRIDNQLRGRCARQGDPGSSRFFLSLDDDIMRIFAADKTKSLLRYIGLSNGMPLEHPMVAKAIERAQRKVEERNFEIRKNLLDYDSVMNEQRMIVYERRQAWLEERDLRETMLDYLEDTVAERIAEFASSDKHREEWDLPGLCAWLRENLLVEMTPGELETFIDGKEDSLLEAVNKRVREAYTQKEKELGAKEQREMEKYLLLQTLDRKWMDHLYAMDLLRESIHLRSYAGQDPKLIYKREGYEMFEDLWDSLREEVVGIIMKIRPVTEASLRLEEAEVGAEIHGDFSAYEAAQERAGANAGEVHHEPIVRVQKKVSRNDPCPCGSGKKYKKCCGRK